MLKRFMPVLCLLVLLLIWQGVTAAGIFNSYVLPSPARTGKAALKMLKSGELFADVMISFQRVLKGFLIAFALAFLCGMVRSLIPFTGDVTEPAIQFLRNVPPLSMIPLLILWFGIGETTKTIIIVLASFFPMYLSIVKGFAGHDKKLSEVGQVFGLTKTQRFFRIILPGAAADILVGMRTGLGYSWRAIIGAEMVAASSGLGHGILMAQQLSRTDKVIVGIFAIGLAGLLTDLIFGLLLKRLAAGYTDNGWE